MAESSPLFGFDPNTTTVVGDYGKVAEAQGDIADAAAQSKSQKAPFDFLGLGKQVAGVAGMFAEEKNMLDAHQAKLRATEFMQNNDYLSGHELAGKVEEQIKTISEGDNFSSGYRKGALAIFDVGYAQALERKEEERIASTMNVLSSNYSTDVANNIANGTAMTEEYAQQWAADMSTKFRVPVEYVRNAMVSSIYQDAQMRVVTAKNRGQLQAAQAYINQATASLKSPLFLDSRSKKFQPVIKSLRSNLDSSISAKNTEFTRAAALAVVTNLEGSQEDVWSSYPNDPDKPENTALVRESTSSPAAFEKKMRTLRQKYAEAQAAREYISTYNLYGATALTPAIEDNPYVGKMIVETAAYNVLTQLQGTGENLDSSFPVNPNSPEMLALIKQASPNPAAAEKTRQFLTQGFEEAETARQFLDNFDLYEARAPLPETEENEYIKDAVEGMVYNEVVANLGNPTQLNAVINNNPEVIGAAGDKLYNAFITMHDPAKLAQLNSSFENALAMPGGAKAMQTMFGDNYKDLVGINIIASTFTGGDVVKARDTLYDSQGAITSPPLNPDLNEDFYKYAGKLGTLGDEFMYSVNTILKINPGLVNKNLLENVYDKFAAGVEEREGIKINVSRFDSAAQALDEDVFNTQVSKMAIRFNGGANPSEVRNLPGNIMVYRDEFGITSGVFNAGPTLAITNGLAAAIANSDSKQVDFYTRSGDTLDVIASSIAAELPTLFDLSPDEMRAAFDRDKKTFASLKEIWAGSDVPRGKISADILSYKAMFPEVISEEVIPDLDERRAAEERNIQYQALIDEIAVSFLGTTLDTKIRSEKIMELYEEAEKRNPGNGWSIFLDPEALK